MKDGIYISIMLDILIYLMKTNDCQLQFYFYI